MVRDIISISISFSVNPSFDAQYEKAERGIASGNIYYDPECNICYTISGPTPRRAKPVYPSNLYDRTLASVP